MWKFNRIEECDLETLLRRQPQGSQAPGCGAVLTRMQCPRPLTREPRGREMLARTQRGLRQRRNEELSELLYQGCLLPMMALPLSMTQVTWRPLAAGHGQRTGERARRELRRGHGPGLVRDVLLGLVNQRTCLAADPVLICREALRRGFHYGAHTLLVVVLRLYRREREALLALEELESHPLSLRQRAACMGHRGFILFAIERKEEAYQAYAAAARMSPEPHHEVGLLIGELMRGDEKRALESGARLQEKIQGIRWRPEASPEACIAVLAQPMRNPIWKARAQDVKRIQAIKRKLSGMPALIADILSTIQVCSEARTPGLDAKPNEGAEQVQSRWNAPTESAGPRAPSGPSRPKHR